MLRIYVSRNAGYSSQPFRIINTNSGLAVFLVSSIYVDKSCTEV